jgi:hypothetical protein
LKNSILILLIAFISACENRPLKVEIANTPFSSSISKTPSDSTKRQARKDTIAFHQTEKVNISKSRAKRERVIRMSEIAASDDKFNGQPVLLQFEMSSDALLAHPDTLKQEIRNTYMASERFFPRYIADNFEKGISTENIAYPKLNFSIELFRDSYAEKPYKVVNFRAWKDNSGSIAVE